MEVVNLLHLSSRSELRQWLKENRVDYIIEMIKKLS